MEVFKESYPKLLYHSYSDIILASLDGNNKYIMQNSQTFQAKLLEDGRVIALNNDGLVEINRRGAKQRRKKSLGKKRIQSKILNKIEIPNAIKFDLINNRYAIVNIGSSGSSGKVFKIVDVNNFFVITTLHGFSSCMVLDDIHYMFISDVDSVIIYYENAYA